MVFALASIAGYTALFLLLAAPPMVLARRRRSPSTVRRFLVAALACGLASGILVASSRQLVERCQNQGNTQCHDSGASGLQFMVIAGFVGTAAVRTWTLITD